MYLFTRQTRLAPEHGFDGMEWAVEVTEKVNQVTSLDVGLWMSTMSPGVGTLSWGCAVESLQDIENAEAKLSVDPTFQDLAQRGAKITIGGLDDQLAQYIVPGGEGNPTVVAVVQSQLANGKFGSGIGAGVEIAQKATELSGMTTAFLVSSTGSYGGVAWITGATSLTELEQGEAAANGNADFLALVDRLSDCFLPGVTTQSIWRRVV